MRKVIYCVVAALVVKFGAIDPYILVAVLIGAATCFRLGRLIAQRQVNYWGDVDEDEEIEENYEVYEITPEQQRDQERAEEQIAILDQEKESEKLNTELTELLSDHDAIAEDEETYKKKCEDYQEVIINLESNRQNTEEQIKFEQENEKEVIKEFEDLSKKENDILKNLNECNKQIEKIESSRVKISNASSVSCLRTVRSDPKLVHIVKPAGDDRGIEHEAESIDLTEQQLSYFKKEKERLVQQHSVVVDKLEEIKKQKEDHKTQIERLRVDLEEKTALVKTEQEKVESCKAQIKELNSRLVARDKELHQCKKAVKKCKDLLITKYENIMLSIKFEINHFQRNHKRQYGYAPRGCDHTGCRERFRSLKEDQKKYNRKINRIKYEE